MSIENYDLDISTPSYEPGAVSQITCHDLYQDDIGFLSQDYKSDRLTWRIQNSLSGS